MEVSRTLQGSMFEGKEDMVNFVDSELLLTRSLPGGLPCSLSLGLLRMF